MTEQTKTHAAEPELLDEYLTNLAQDPRVPDYAAPFVAASIDGLEASEGMHTALESLAFSARMAGAVAESATKLASDRDDEGMAESAREARLHALQSGLAYQQALVTSNSALMVQASMEGVMALLAGDLDLRALARGLTLWSGGTTDTSALTLLEAAKAANEARAEALDKWHATECDECAAEVDEAEGDVPGLEGFLRDLLGATASEGDDEEGEE